MIISPPFLPEQGSAGHADDEAYVESAMLDSLDTMIATGGAPAGSYPLGTALTWHNGLHLRAPSDAKKQGRLPVRAIADGTVIFMRAPKPANTDATDPQNYNLIGAKPSWTDNGIVIVRHTTDIGATGNTPTSVTYFSVYMHLSSIENTVLENKPIWRKDKIGKAGQIFGRDNQIHFEICMDAANLQGLVGASRPISWTDPSVAPTSHGRTDAVFGSVYIYLPVGTPTSPTLPSNHISRPQAGASAATDHFVPDTLREPQWVEISYSKGHGTVRSYRATDAKDGTKAGTPIGKPLPEPDFEYNLYTEANKRHNSLDTANQISSSPSGWYELLRFGRNLGPDKLPGNAAHWREIPTASGTVWADLNAHNTLKFSDADFPAFKGWQFFDDDTSQEDQRCDSVELKRLIRDPKAAPESIHARVALTMRLGNADVREKLKRAICKFPTEWDRSTFAQRYGWLKVDEEFKVEQGKPWNDFSAHCEAITFEGLPQEYRDANWHIHPRVFIALMRRCWWLSARELALIYPDSNYPLTALAKAGRSPESIRTQYLIHVNLVIRRYLVNTPTRCTHFFGQGAVESMMLALMIEGSAAYSRNPNHASFRSEIGGHYVPTNPNDYLFYLEGKLGNIEPGDGPKFRGRGMKQLTGRENYSKYWVYRGWISIQNYPIENSGLFKKPWWNPTRISRAPKIANPQELSVNDHSAIDAGGWYWIGGSSANKFQPINNAIVECDISYATIKQVTKAINGGENGLSDRQSQTNRISAILMDTP